MNINRLHQLRELAAEAGADISDCGIQMQLNELQQQFDAAEYDESKRRIALKAKSLVANSAQTLVVAAQNQAKTGYSEADRQDWQSAADEIRNWISSGAPYQPCVALMGMSL